MKRIALFILLVFVAFSCKPHVFPVIDNILAEPDSVYPGDTLALSFTSSNIHQVDQFEWSCSFGTLVSSNNLSYGSTRWIAPGKLGTCYIKLRLFHGTNITTDSIKVIVLDTTGTFIDTRDNHNYKWKRIGKQIWMVENLSYLPKINSVEAYGQLEKYFYVYGYTGTNVLAAKQSANYLTYGVLYNYPAAIEACPGGWHLPGYDEWMILIKYLNPHPGIKLKSVYGWEKDYYGNDCNGNNSSGFDVLPGGATNYHPVHGLGYFAAGQYALFWSKAYYSFILIQSSDYDLIPDDAQNGLSVRCINNFH